MSKKPLISVYADGSSNGKAGSAIGYGYVIVWNHTDILHTGSGGGVSGTNNTAELLAAINGLSLVKNLNLGNTVDVELVSDSQYVLGLANGTYSPTKNVSLAVQVESLTRGLGATTRWVKGHSGDKHQEMCDKLAKAEKLKFFTPVREQVNRTPTYVSDGEVQVEVIKRGSYKSARTVLTDEEKRAIVNGFDHTKMTEMEYVKGFGISTKTFQTWAKQLGITINIGLHTDAEKRAIIKGRKKTKMSKTMYALHKRINRKTLTEWAFKLGIKDW